MDKSNKRIRSRRNGGNRKTGSGMSDYVKEIIPEGAVLDFIFYEDFDGDGIKEAIIGFTEFLPFPPESSVLYIRSSGECYKHEELLSSNNHTDIRSFGIFDNAAAEDTDGDGLPEFVLSLAVENGHYTTVFVFDWTAGKPVLRWYSDEDFYHGSIEVLDIDDDGVCEIIIDRGITEGSEILALDKACYHFRESTIFKWDGIGYNGMPHKVRMPYLSYNTAVIFLNALWNRDFKCAYGMAVMPGFLGLDGLDDSSYGAFKRYAEKNIRPVLQRNLTMGKFVPAEPYDTYCLFNGSHDDLTIELVKNKNRIMVQCLNIYKKNLE